MFKILLAAATLSLVTASPSYAAPCKDGHGRFVKCHDTKPKPMKCRKDGKFAKCGTRGARPF